MMLLMMLLADVSDIPPLLQSTGDQALDVLQYLFSNDLDVPVGHIVHTGMLNHNGGYENDCSIVRVNKRR